MRNDPKSSGRRSRFFGSHLGPAYLTLFMIFNVIWTMFLFRGAVEARDMGNLTGYGKGAFVSYGARHRARPTASTPSSAGASACCCTSA